MITHSFPRTFVGATLALSFAGLQWAIASNPATSDGETLQIWVARQFETETGDSVSVDHGELIGIYTTISCQSLTVEWSDKGGVNEACFDSTVPTAAPGDVGVYTVIARATWSPAEGKQPIVATVQLRVQPFVDITGIDVVGVDQTTQMTATYSPAEIPQGFTVTWTSSDIQKAEMQDNTETIVGKAEGQVVISVSYYDPTTSLEGTDTRDVSVTKCFIKSFSCSCQHQGREDIDVATDGKFQVAFFDGESPEDVTISVVPGVLGNYCVVPAHCYWTGIGRQISITAEAPEYEAVPPILYFYEPTSAEYEVNDCVHDPNKVKITVESFPSASTSYEKDLFKLEKNLKPGELWKKFWAYKVDFGFHLQYGGQESLAEDSDSWRVDYNGKWFLNGSAGIDAELSIPLPIPPPVPPDFAKVGVGVGGSLTAGLTASTVNRAPLTIAGEAEASVYIKIFVKAGYSFAYAEAGAKASAGLAGPFVNPRTIEIEVDGTLTLGKLTVYVAVGSDSIFGKYEAKRERVIYEGKSWPVDVPVFP